MYVAPRKRRVSRNKRNHHTDSGQQVAPRKRRVSRNACWMIPSISFCVAPRKRRVSRNLYFLPIAVFKFSSRLARGV